MLGILLSNVAAGMLLVTTSFGGVGQVNSTPNTTAKQVVAQAWNTEEQNYPSFPKSGDSVIKQKITVTAYSSTPDQTDDSPFITANGTVVHDGIVAANFLKFGTRVRFPKLYGDKVFVVTDRMNTRYYYHLDIWMPSREAAKKFGVKQVDVEILPPVRELAMNK